MSGNENVTGSAQGSWGWQPVPHGGDYDADATAFVKLPDEMLGGAGTGEPLEAPGHGYVPPVIVTSGAGTDPAATGTWSIPVDWQGDAGPGGVAAAGAGAAAGVAGAGAAAGVAGAGAEQAGSDAGGAWGAGGAEPSGAWNAVPSAEWPEAGAGAVGAMGAGQADAGSAGAGAWGAVPAGDWPEAGGLAHGDTAEWRFPDADGTSGGAALTGQWSIPVAQGDLPEESGEYTRSTLAPEWAHQAPATLPGGAAAPWAEQLQQWPVPSAEAVAEAAAEHTEGSGTAFDGVRGYVAPPADYTGTAVRVPYAGADDSDAGAGAAGAADAYAGHGAEGHAGAGHGADAFGTDGRGVALGHGGAGHLDDGHAGAGHVDDGHAGAGHVGAGHVDDGFGTDGHGLSGAGHGVAADGAAGGGAGAAAAGPRVASWGTDAAGQVPGGHPEAAVAADLLTGLEAQRDYPAGAGAPAAGPDATGAGFPGGPAPVGAGAARQSADPAELREAALAHTATGAAAPALPEGFEAAGLPEGFEAAAAPDAPGAGDRDTAGAGERAAFTAAGTPGLPARGSGPDGAGQGVPAHGGTAYGTPAHGTPVHETSAGGSGSDGTGQGVPAHGSAAYGTPAHGIPVQETSAAGPGGTGQGVPAHGSAGTPVHEIPAQGVDAHRLPAEGTPVPGAPAYGAPTYGQPGHDFPAHGTSPHGTPPHGTPAHGTPLHPGAADGFPGDAGADAVRGSAEPDAEAQDGHPAPQPTAELPATAPRGSRALRRGLGTGAPAAARAAAAPAGDEPVQHSAAPDDEARARGARDDARQPEAPRSEGTGAPAAAGTDADAAVPSPEAADAPEVTDGAAPAAPESDSAPEAARAGDATPEPRTEARAATPAAHPEGAGPADAHHEHPHASYVLRVNGADRPVTGAWIGESLLYVLRERLGLAGAKDGCSQGECGACAVQVDGRLVASCLVPAATAAGSEVRTVEGLAQNGRLSDVQQALCRSGAVQCGFCVPGMAMTIHDLLEGNHAPTELETRQALCGNLCRCSGYQGVLQAVREVVTEREEAAAAQADPAPEARIPHQAPPGAGGIHHDGGMA
ncbi:2Fe-2S iron-sulfur cluster-binding protein [Streptomyces sp. NPDC086023]|uniref:2Fe-2S iron-sulfur cluster-binding protein n=1 Tax=Streptomyces sp. NPDC086023 TaxID=3365746 RepID=UPI0037CDAE03